MAQAKWTENDLDRMLPIKRLLALMPGGWVASGETRLYFSYKDYEWCIGKTHDAIAMKDTYTIVYIDWGEQDYEILGAYPDIEKALFVFEGAIRKWLKSQ